MVDSDTYPSIPPPLPEDSSDDELPVQRKSVVPPGGYSTFQVELEGSGEASSVVNPGSCATTVQASFELSPCDDEYYEEKSDRDSHGYTPTSQVSLELSPGDASQVNPNTYESTLEVPGERLMGDEQEEPNESLLESPSCIPSFDVPVEGSETSDSEKKVLKPTVRPEISSGDSEDGDNQPETQKIRIDTAAVRKRIDELTTQFSTPLRAGTGSKEPLGSAFPERRSASDLYEASQKPIDWQVRNLWTKHAKILIASEPKAGKTWFVCAIAICMSKGIPLFGEHEIVEPCPVGIIAAEDDEGETGRRMQRMCKAMGLNLKELPIHWWQGDAIRLNRPRDTEWIKRQVRELGIKMMIYDPLARLMDGDENSKQCVSDVLTPASALTREQNEGCSVCIVHHLGKDDPDRPRSAAQRVRGSSDIRSWYTSGIFLSGLLSNGRVNVELEQRVSGKLPRDFVVRAVEDEDTSVYGLGTLKLVSNTQREMSSLERAGENEKVIEEAVDRIRGLMERKRQYGVTLSEITVHTGLGRLVVNAALKKLIREDETVEFVDAKDIPEGKILMFTNGQRQPGRSSKFPPKNGRSGSVVPSAVADALANYQQKRREENWYDKEPNYNFPSTPSPAPVDAPKDLFGEPEEDQ